ncbi:PREDICTED: glycine-rich protein DOT1-like [Nicotiana attenuata]|uniref:glycine-rich protein DOT1-like n=1 Tax=Nicotiana attenuata TaxID=49451 RepID=UPI00090488F2|nr:PREDICTED: glycine-rich protein DOT1-like [Nicotiana attenuata]
MTIFPARRAEGRNSISGGVGVAAGDGDGTTGKWQNSDRQNGQKSVGNHEFLTTFRPKLVGRKIVAGGEGGGGDGDGGGGGDGYGGGVEGDGGGGEGGGSGDGCCRLGGGLREGLLLGEFFGDFPMEGHLNLKR